MECGKAAPSGVRKMKKKQVKDESDRIKQAEKKRRRLEKALATSAAIISELEKKKQMKKEEQQRLDEEGAAIAEAVALQVLIGEDSDETCSRVNCNQQVYNNPNEEFGWIINANGGSICQWNGYGRSENGSFVRGFEGQYVDEAGLMAAQAVSALQIADDEDMKAFVFNRMVRGLSKHAQYDSTSNKAYGNGNFLGLHDLMGHDAYKYILATLVAAYPFRHRLDIFWPTRREYSNLHSPSPPDCNLGMYISSPRKQAFPPSKQSKFKYLQEKLDGLMETARDCKRPTRHCCLERVTVSLHVCGAFGLVHLSLHT
ncbi:hypothetical protein L1987_76005 [Smallanthus sonchifolius]|uniref:Uncharacterized protein n=1 Tax=Smallanthus sonchifolius TaxID=185202 RepID=A0ACB9A6C3_9ASTR|nr:hypothetical protein L1987_76005 [Smallanthus sonchifolius]